MSFKEQQDFSKFGKHFQEKLVQIMFEDRPFCDQISEVLDIGFFELKYLQVFTGKLLNYKAKYDKHPSMEGMATILRSDLDAENEIVAKQTRDYFIRVKTNAYIEDEEYIKETSLDFCKKQKLKEALIKSANLLQKASFDQISDLINTALKLGTDNNYGYDFKLDFEERFLLKHRSPVTTGWPQIDKIVKGGLGSGELGVVIAPTGAGKSMALVHLGSMALMRGLQVVHYTLELGDTVVASRYDSCVTGYHLKDLFHVKEAIYEKIKNISGNLLVKEYPTKSVSVNSLRTHLQKLKSANVPIDMIIVDYADLLKPKASYKEKRLELETIYEELRGLAQEFKCPIWTASQTNRGGLNAEVITMESISEAFNKCFVADFIFTISRTIEDKNANTARMFVAKNRNGVDGLIFPMFMDTSNVKLEVLEPTGESIDDINKNAAKKQEESLREKYKKFKEKKNGTSN
tara:strand:- start:956 stop:2338 length:1383 start_codon:yes stop_codon:yes gene_type:complete